VPISQIGAHQENPQFRILGDVSHESGTVQGCCFRVEESKISPVSFILTKYKISHQLVSLDSREKFTQ